MNWMRIPPSIPLKTFNCRIFRSILFDARDFWNSMYLWMNLSTKRDEHGISPSTDRESDFFKPIVIPSFKKCTSVGGSLANVFCNLIKWCSVFVVVKTEICTRFAYEFNRKCLTKSALQFKGNSRNVKHYPVKFVRSTSLYRRQNLLIWKFTSFWHHKCKDRDEDDEKKNTEYPIRIEKEKRRRSIFKRQKNKQLLHIFQQLRNQNERKYKWKFLEENDAVQKVVLPLESHNESTYSHE